MIMSDNVEYTTFFSETNYQQLDNLHSCLDAIIKRDKIEISDLNDLVIEFGFKKKLYNQVFNREKYQALTIDDLKRIKEITISAIASEENQAQIRKLN